MFLLKGHSDLFELFYKSQILFLEVGITALEKSLLEFPEGVLTCWALPLTHLSKRCGAMVKSMSSKINGSLHFPALILGKLYIFSNLILKFRIKIIIITRVLKVK